MRPAVAALLLALLVPVAHAAGTPPELRYEGNRLTARIDRVPLDEVLGALSRETGIEIHGEPLDAREVSKQFDDVPLPEALKRLIGRQNFVLRYGPDGTPQRIDLLGAPRGPQKPATARSLDAVQLMTSMPPVVVPPHAARALGGRSLGLPRLLAGLKHDDRQVRDEAAATIVRAIEARADVLAAVEAMDPGQLGRLLAHGAGPHAAEAMTLLYRAARHPRLRHKLAAARVAAQRITGRGG